MNKCHERAKKSADDVLRRLSSSTDLVASDATVWICESAFFTKKYIRTAKRTETEHMAEHPMDNAMKSNFEKLCRWFDEQTPISRAVYSGWASCKNVFICRNRSKCLLFKIDEKAVKKILPKFIFFEPGRSKVVCFTDMASTTLSEQIICTKIGKRILIMKKWELLLPPQI